MIEKIFMSQVLRFLMLIMILYQLFKICYVINMEHKTILTFKRQVDWLEVKAITVGLQCRGGKLNGFFNDNFLKFSNINDFHIRT